MKALALLLLTVPAWGLSNAVTIQTASAAPATQVHRVPRWFAEGEIAGHPRPFVNNLPAASWQAEVKNRWADGSVRFAIVSFQAGVPAGGSITVDFRNSPDACHLGGSPTCQAAALNAAGMLNHNGGNWQAAMVVRADPAGATSTAAVQARTMIQNGHFTYWIRGPVETVVRVEDESPARQYDFGWIGAGCTQPYDSCSWSNDSTHRSLHPIFVLSFPSGGAGVRIEFILANYWTTVRQDQRYSLSLQTSAGEVFQKSGIRSAWSTWWRKTYWDGPIPVETNIDFNLEYLRMSKMVMPFRTGIQIKDTGDWSAATSLSLYSSNTNADFPFWCSSNSIYCGSRTRAYPATGGREDRGFYPLWESHWLHSMRADLFKVVLGNAEWLGSQNIHLRESGSGLTYMAGVDAFGKPNSLDARPTAWRQSNSVSNLPASVGPVAAVDANGSWNKWTPDAAHLHTHSQLAYLVTGDWYFMQEQSFLAHHNFLWFQQASYLTYTRPNTWGTIAAMETNHRLVAWLLWNVWRGYLIVPDGEVQKEYLREKMEDAIAILEGYYNITDGDHHAPCTSEPYSPTIESSKWCWGHKMMGFATTGNIGFSQMIGSSAQRQNLNPAQVRFGSSPWMDNFVSLAFFDMCRTEGRACPIARHHAKRQAQIVNETGANPRMFVWYHMPVAKLVETTLTAGITASATVIPVADASLCPPPPTVITIGGEHIYIAARDLQNNTLTAGSTSRGGRSYNGTTAFAASAGATVTFLRQFDSFAEMLGTYTGSSTYDLSASLVRGSVDGVGDNYVSLQCGTAIWSEDFSPSGRAAEAWLANCPDNDLGGAFGKYSNESDPRWVLTSDRPVRQVRATVAGDSATLRYVAPHGGRCRVYVGSSPPATSDDVGDPEDTANGRLHTFTATGLAAGTKHYRISCGTMRTLGTFSVP